MLLGWLSDLFLRSSNRLDRWRHVSVNDDRQYAGGRRATAKCGDWRNYGSNLSDHAAAGTHSSGCYGDSVFFAGAIWGDDYLLTNVASDVKADSYAHDANTKRIDRINYLAMAGLGTIFGLIVVLFFIGGAARNQAVAAIPQWLMGGLGAAGA